MTSSDNPLSFRNLLSGIIVTIIGGIILAYIIQDARYAKPSPSLPVQETTVTLIQKESAMNPANFAADIPSDPFSLTPTLTSPNSEVLPAGINTSLPTQTHIPSNTLIASPIATLSESWQGEYYNNQEFRSPAAHTRQDAGIDFNWGTANPAPNVNFDYFSVRWTKCTQFEERYYVFEGVANDFMTVWLDNVQVLHVERGSGSQKVYVSSGSHCLRIEYLENTEEALAYFSYKAAEQPTPAAFTETWQGEYYNNQEFRSPTAHTRQDAWIDFNWGAANPAPNVNFDYFSVRWTKCTQFEERYYVFEGVANDFMTVWLDNVQVLHVERGSGNQKVYVSSGSHCLRVEYLENTEEALAYFSYKAAEQPTPAAFTGTWQGEYYNNQEFRSPAAHTRQDAWIDFNWGTANPAPNVNFDYFSVRWTKCIELEERSYLFHARANDYIEVFMDGNKILDTDQATKTQEIITSAGLHCFEVKYRENTEDAWVNFWWE